MSSPLPAASRKRLLQAAALQPKVSSTLKLARSSKHLRSKDLASMIRKENINNHNTATSTAKEGTVSPSITAEALRTMNFRPLNLPKPRPSPGNLIDGRVLTVEPRSTNNISALDRSNFSSPPASRRRRASSSHPNGVWSKRFQTLKSNQTNDAMKLQHAGVTRYGLSFDLNDPRKKAESFTDVTVLDLGPITDGTFQWNHHCHQTSSSNGCNNANEGPLLTLPCYIHKHQPKSDEKLGGGASMSQVLAWISMTPTTARNVGLQKDISLRIYDAVLLPIRDTSEFAQGEVNFRHLILCTQLCEKSPTTLDPVPEDVIHAFDTPARN